MKATARVLLKIFLILLVVLLLLLGISRIMMGKYVYLNGKFYAVSIEQLCLQGERVPDLDRLCRFENLKTLDLRGLPLTLGEHEWLQQKLPQCKILWRVPFGGQYYAEDVKTITLENLTSGDVLMLEDLPELKSITLKHCDDLTALSNLLKSRPACRVFYTVKLGNQSFQQDTKAMELQNVDLSRLSEILPVLPEVREVGFFGILPEMEDLKAIKERFPAVHFSWEVSIQGKTFRENETQADLSCEIIEDPQSLIRQLQYFENLQFLDLRGVILSDDQKQQLNTSFPKTEILYHDTLGNLNLAADTEVLDLSGHGELSLEEIRKACAYLPNLQKLILCDCGFSNEALSSLRDSLAPVKVVWNVWAGGRDTRTDETYFAPNKWGLKMTDENIRDLQYCTDMVCVDIGHSKQVTNCSWAQNMENLEFLILADSSIKDLSPLKNLKKLRYLELFLIPGQDLSPLTELTALEDLNLSYVYADPAPVAEMTWLKRLWWPGCWAAKNQLAEGLPDTEKNFTSASSTGEGWREGKLYFEMRDFIGMGYMKG